MRTDVLIHKDKNLVEGLQKLNALRDISRLILFVVDDNGRVIGSVTDGDIRRAIVSEQQLEKKLEDICYKGFTYLTQRYKNFTYSGW